MSPSRQLASFIKKFSPALARHIRASRALLRKQFPTAHQLVYDNYNFFVIGFCSSPRPSHCIVSLAAHSRGIILSFYHGAHLPDPHRLLQGKGKQHRYIRLPSPNTLKSPHIQSLLKAAATHAKSPLTKSGPATLIIQSISTKQRPRK